MTDSEKLNYVVGMAVKVIPNSITSTESMTVRQFCKEFVRITNSRRKPIEFQSIVADALVGNGIKPSIKVNGNPYYSKYNFKEILVENLTAATNYFKSKSRQSNS